MDDPFELTSNFILFSATNLHISYRWPQYRDRQQLGFYMRVNQPLDEEAEVGQIQVSIDHVEIMSRTSLSKLYRSIN